MSLITSPNLKRKLKLILAVFLAALALTWSGYAALSLLPDHLAEFQAREWPSVLVEDREGRVLREVLSSQETRSEWTPLSGISRHVAAAALAAEDKRYYSHPGVDLLAVGRALLQNLKAVRIVSGASTITMQLT
ncbi:MAG: transglycosylase domain-containing protein, partial [Deltaproteobacteria bacterium]|nr:transglycosylase domain-containing protein [Deltaproteobacteria bacterium]